MRRNQSRDHVGARDAFNEALKRDKSHPDARKNLRKAELAIENDNRYKYGY